jgi:hypothetical protein
MITFVTYSKQHHPVKGSSRVPREGSSTQRILDPEDPRESVITGKPALSIPPPLLTVKSAFPPPRGHHSRIYLLWLLCPSHLLTQPTTSLTRLLFLSVRASCVLLKRERIMIFLCARAMDNLNVALGGEGEMIMKAGRWGDVVWKLTCGVDTTVGEK